MLNNSYHIKKTSIIHNISDSMKALETTKYIILETTTKYLVLI